ncbi:DNA circularization protein [Cronobacter dublinensis]|uniref:DNA circularization protein n=1 Tax=Cronobacter dublinensis TaxID=413497 RepID=UPI000CFC87F8|nr:DNA circularization N-terminal domain-containing protein [Cronobacter dublinensis]
MAFETGWRARLQSASFRSVPFEVESDEGIFGRRVQVHEYPNRDKPFTEDLGRAARRITINAYLIGDDYPEKRDRLIAAIETEGAATLVHPYYGEMKGNVDGQVRVTHSNQEGRMCRVSFQFVESGELTFPTSGTATDASLDSSAGSLADAISGDFSAFSLDGLSDFVQSGVLADAAEMFDVIADAFTMVDSGISAAMRLVQGDLSVILMPPSSANDFVRNLQKAWRAGTRLSGDASALVTMVKTISGVTVDSGLAPRGIWSTDSGTTASRKAQTNLVASTMRVVSISEAARAVAQIPTPPGNRALQGGANPVSDIVNISHPALDSQPATTARATPATWDDLTDIRTALNAAIDSEQARTTDDAVFMALTTLRANLNKDISSRLAQVEKTVSVTPSESLPAVVLAAQWFDDASRETDILYRNNIAHPGFVPVVPLRVPVR